MRSVRDLVESLNRSKFVSLKEIPITVEVFRDFPIYKCSYRDWLKKKRNRKLLGLAVEYLVRANISKDSLHFIASQSLREGWKRNTIPIIEGLKRDFYLNASRCNGFNSTSARSILFLLQFRKVSWNRFKSPSFLPLLITNISLVSLIPDRAIEDIKDRAKFCFKYLLSLEGGKVISGFQFRKFGFISRGEADIVTPNSVIDIKVLGRHPSTFDWIQVITYYLLGRLDSYVYEKEGTHFSSIKNLKIINPSKGLTYVLKVEDLLSRGDLIFSISREIIFRRNIFDKGAMIRYFIDIYWKIFRGYMVKFRGNTLMSKSATFSRIENFFTKDELKFLNILFLYFLKNR